MLDLMNVGNNMVTLAQPLAAVRNDWLTLDGWSGVTDHIHRTIATSSAVMTVSWETTNVVSHFRNWESEHSEDVAALKRVVNYQRKYISYQATYNAYLLGTLSEDEFELESDAYVSDERSVPVAELALTIARLDRLLEFNLSDREIGEYLEVAPSLLQQALAYVKKGFVDEAFFKVSAAMPSISLET